MGFWETAGKVAKGTMNHIEKQHNEVQELAQRYESESVDFLKQKLKSGSTTQKLAAAKILKSRGYTAATL